PEIIKEKYPNLAQVGTIDIQYTLPFGNKEDIENEVKNIISVAAHGGGLIMGPQHNIQPDVPIENVKIMVKAIRKFGKYPIKNE
ncbi:MAG: uroporphyrinogen decarboxylase family protein, partial [Candidatus Methanomethylicaceae archaeon]